MDFEHGKTFKVFYRYFVYISFFTCILWIYTEANEVVGLLTALGFIWKIDSAIMGLTFLAWANSVGDLVSDISLAKAGKARTAVAACFGTPLLNLLGMFLIKILNSTLVRLFWKWKKVGVGVGCTIGILTVEGKENGVELFVSVKKHFENDWNKIYKKFQLDDLSMGLAGGVAFILVFLLIFLPLADFKVAKEGSSNNCYGKYTTELTHHNDTFIMKVS